MASVIYRPDYAKFVFDLPRGLFAHLYERVREAAGSRKYHGEWHNSHHVQALPHLDINRERTVLEIWGEWAQVIELLPFDTFAPALKRFDVRGIQWDADGSAVLTVGQSLQRAGIGYNVEVFNSKPASKRLGRDRGGQGFRVGSRKSDLCLVVYKRASEPVAVEFRLQDRILRRALETVVDNWERDDRVFSRWPKLIELAASYGNVRLSRSMEAAGLGTYWPTSEQLSLADIHVSQKSFAAMVAAIGTSPHEAGSPLDSDAPFPDEHQR